MRGGRAWQFVEELRTDVRYGLRWLTRSPGFAAAAILSLGLGIGANTAVFSLLDAVLLKSLPVAHPESLAVMSYVTGHPADGGEPMYPLHLSHVRGAAAARRIALRRRRVGAVHGERRCRGRERARRQCAWRCWRGGDAERAGTDGLRQLLHAARRERGGGAPHRAG